jgi:sec-independent protein translocase protein TatA
MPSYLLEMLNEGHTFAMLNGWEIVLILAVVLILFGAKKLPGLAKGFGQGIKEFKTGMRENSDKSGQALTPTDTYGHLRTPADASDKA